MNEILLSSITLHELESRFETIVEKSIKNALNRGVAAASEKIDTELVDISSACQILGLAKPTVYALVSKRSIVSYKRGKKLYFNRSELIQWIQNGRRVSASELHLQAKLLAK
jgi:excisionase family DNA binding protein